MVVKYLSEKQNKTRKAQCYRTKDGALVSKTLFCRLDEKFN